MQSGGTSREIGQEPSIASAVAALARALARAGLDLVQPFETARYDALVAGHPTVGPLPAFGRSSAAAVLVGATRALWPALIDAMAASPALRDSPHPVDRYTEQVLGAAMAALPVASEVRFAHDRGPGLVSMLHAAEASGLAARGPAHLAVHPVFGPWIGLRAVIVLDAPPLGPTPSAVPICVGCAAPCTGAFEQARATDDGQPRFVERHWEAWLRIRQVCPVGRAAAYDAEQARYHYTKDLDRLRALVAGRAAADVDPGRAPPGDGG